MRTSLSIDFQTLKANGSSVPHTDLHSKRLSVDDLDYDKVMYVDAIGKASAITGDFFVASPK